MCRSDCPARVSTGKRPEDAFPSSKGEAADTGLIRFLMQNGHGTPFEHAVFQLFVKAPIFVVREWQRHRMASYNEQSGRYSEFHPEFYVPDHVRTPDPVNKQSSIKNETIDQAMRDAIRFSLKGTAELAFDSYRQMLDNGVAREMARMILPLSTYTSFWFTVNARSLMNFMELRNAPAAQWEIQQYAAAVEGTFAGAMPLTYAAWIDADRRAP
jgi:thymidylate synthase (FAD)